MPSSVLNGRLYLHAWFIATVALLVAFLTLAPVAEVNDADQVAVFGGTDATALAQQFQLAAPLRVPGTPGADAGEKWITEQFQRLPDGDRRVAIQRAVVRREGERIPIANVLFTVPAGSQTKSQRNILVVAPRDAPRQVSGGGSGTAMLAELARIAGRSKYHHPLIFLSVDADTLGNAGLRWYLSSVETSRIAGVIILDAPAESDRNALYIWSSGRGRQALAMRQLAERAISSAGFTTEPLPSLRGQLIQQAVTETRGAQRAAIDKGVPAVTLSARPESPLPPDVDPVEVEQMKGAGTAALALISLLDATERANAPDGALAYAGRILRPAVVRLSLLFLALPLFVMALDSVARIRRSRVRVSSGVRAVAWRLVPIAFALLLGRLLTMWGVLRAPDVGRAPPPLDVRFDGQAVLALLLIILSAVALWMLLRPRILAIGAGTESETAGALLMLSVAVLGAWWLLPFSLVLILPAAYAVLTALVAPRVWQLLLLAVGSLLTPIAVLFHVADVLDRSPAYALWYLTQTSLSGGRGVAGPIIAALVLVAIAVLVGLVVARVRAGLGDGGEVRKGLGWLTSNLSARKRRRGDNDADRAEETRRRPLPSGDSRRG